MISRKRTRGVSRLVWLTPRVLLARFFSLGVLLITSVACTLTPLTPPPTPTDPIPNLVLPNSTLVAGVTETPPHILLGTQVLTVAIGSAALPTATPEPNLPARLLIPKLNVDEAIVDVPIVNGEWDISGLGSQVGWLPTTGQQPGEAWAMAFVGHVSLENGTSGPFGYLWQLRVGAEIIFQRGSTQYVYALTEKRDVGADAVKDLYVADGHQIVLMTCDNWDFVNWRYTERLLVLAKLIEERETQK